jgi:hypothetical protein
VFSVSAIFAQSGRAISVKGQVLDGESGKSPLPGVTVAVISKQSNKILAGTFSDNNGYFSIRKVLPDSAILQLSLIGYETKRLEINFTGSDTLSLGEIRLKASSITLKTVVIKGEKPPIEYYVDKQVVNIDKLPVSPSSVAEALKMVGAVEIHPVTNKITIRGRSGVKILLDGKPFQFNDDYLSQMPAELIEKIEVITSPSAKDDPEGDAGILNLISKPNLFDSFSGFVNLRQTSNEETRPSFALNYKRGKTNVFTNMYFGHYHYTTSYDESFISKSSAETAFTRSVGEGGVKNDVYYLKLGVDYEPDESNYFLLSSSATNQKMDIDYTNASQRRTDYRDQNTAEQNTWYNYNSGQNSKYATYILTGFYRNKINDEGCEVTSDIYYANIREDASNNYSTKYYDRQDYPYLQRQNNQIKNNTFILKAGYVNPFKESAKFEAGYNLTFRDRSDDYGSLDFSYLRNAWEDSLNFSNTFKYKESIHAVYFLYSGKLLDINYRLGLRGEKAYTEGLQTVSGENFTENYYSIYPSVNLSYNIGQMQLFINYSRRVQRPEMNYVNPFRRNRSPYSASEGNSELDPVYTNSISAGLMPYLTMFYYGSKGKIINAETMLQDSVLFSTYINGPKTQEFGLELNLNLSRGKSSPIKLPEWFPMMNTKINLSRFIQEGTYMQEDLSENKTNFYLSSYASFSLWYKSKASVSFSYRPESKSQRYKMSSMTDMTISLSRQFLKNSLRVTLTLNDVLNKARATYETHAYNYSTRLNAVPQNSRYLSLSINYLFNSYEDKEEREVDDGRDRHSGM